VKPTFSDLIQGFNPDIYAIEEIRDDAEVPHFIVDDMSQGKPVRRSDAIKVLNALSLYYLVEEPWTLDNVKVELFPTFQEIVTTHGLDLANLATCAGVSYTIIESLLLDQPIPEDKARLLLQMASRMSEHIYRLEQVDLKIEGVDCNGVNRSACP
jgi:hypothetical protein